MLEIGELVLCTVDRIIGTSVFVKIEGTGEEGSIVFSEIAPGRIRNIREYVVPKKKIVCKILRVSGGRIDLSFRRVTLKEQKEVKESYNQEKSYESILRSILGQKAEETIEAISKKKRIYDFINDAKTDSKQLEKIAGKENSKKVLEIINTQQKKKTTIIKKEINLTCQGENGLDVIKGILGKVKGVEVIYLAAGRYFLKTESSEIKKADNELSAILLEIEKEAKKAGAEFSILKK